MINLFRSKSILVVLIAALCAAEPLYGANEDKAGITHTALLQQVVPGTGNEEVTVWDTEYAPGARNPPHLHPAAITFHVLSGAGVWQEDGKTPITLHAGDSLFVSAGTVHSHWNPSSSEPLRFLEFIVAEKGKGRSIPRPSMR